MTKVRPKNTGFLAAAAVSAVALTMAGIQGAGAQTYTMKIGTPTINDTQHEWMKRFKAKIEKKTGGKLQVKLFPSSQLGPIPRMIEGMQLGTIESVTAPALFFVGVDRRNSAMYVPGMYPSLENCSKTVADPEFRKTIFPMMANKGIVAIGIYCTAPQAILTKKKINGLADFKGLKIRVLASDLEIKPMQALGINPTPMPFAAVVPGLQRGLIDGISSIPILFQRLKMYTIAKNITMTRLVYFPIPVYVSKIWWDKIPADMKKQILETSIEVEKELIPFNIKANAETLDIWKKEGGTVGQLPEADQKKMVEIVQAAAAKVLKSQPDVDAIYKVIAKVVAKYK